VESGYERLQVGLVEELDLVDQENDPGPMVLGSLAKWRRNETGVQGPVRSSQTLEAQSP
jgi:hypothetical protein